MPTGLITVVETPTFQRLSDAVWDEATRFAFIDFIARTPDAGDLIPGTGGVRKLRWGGPGIGKRGGSRVIYFYHDPSMPPFPPLVYAKARRDDMTQDERKQVRVLATTLRREYGRGK